jgi:uncharacterized protein (DUF1697 family)
MAQVVLLRGVNVGGHRRFRPAVLARQLRHLDVVNIGAAGTFVVRRPVSPRQLRAEFARRLPFETEIMILPAPQISRLVARSPFRTTAARGGEVQFVSVLARAPRLAPALPIFLPSRRDWLLRIQARDGRFVFGSYRRHMKVIGYLGRLDRLFSVAATTRNWKTVEAIAAVILGDGKADRSSGTQLTYSVFQ